MKSVEGVLLKRGMRVKLTHPDKGYSIGRGNPLVGTEWECEGSVDGDGHVRWDNGHGNSYKSGELSLADKCINIWVLPWP